MVGDYTLLSAQPLLRITAIQTDLNFIENRPPVGVSSQAGWSNPIKTTTAREREPTGPGTEVEDTRMARTIAHGPLTSGPTSLPGKCRESQLVVHRGRTYRSLSRLGPVIGII